MYYHHSWSEIHLVARNQSQILNSYTHCETKLEELHEIFFTNILREQKLQFGSWSEEKFQTLQVAHLSGDWAPFLAWLASCEVCRVFFGWIEQISGSQRLLRLCCYSSSSSCPKTTLTWPAHQKAQDWLSCFSFGASCLPLSCLAFLSYPLFECISFLS